MSRPRNKAPVQIGRALRLDHRGALRLLRDLAQDRALLADLRRLWARELATTSMSFVADDQVLTQLATRVATGSLVIARVPPPLVVCRVSSTEGGGKGPTPEPPSPKPPEPEPTPVNPLIEPLALVVVVQKSAKNPTSGATEPYTHPKRQPITLKTDAAFDGTATFTCDKPDKVKFFSAAKDGTEIKLDGTANVFKPRSAPPWAPAGASISSGVTVFVAGAAASGAMDDITVKLALSGGSKPVGGWPEPEPPRCG